MSAKGAEERKSLMDDRIGGTLKKLLLAGIGAVATTAEKSQEILDDLVKKGEITVEQGKELNKELKHNIKKTVKEKFGPEDVDDKLSRMTVEELAALREKVAAAEAKAAEEAAAVDAEILEEFEDDEVEEVKDTAEE